jgi:fatty acid desaturase
MHRNAWLILETLFVFVTMSAAAVLLGTSQLPPQYFWPLYVPLLMFQGLWFYRFYIVGHEASHKKLFAENLKANDFWGGLTLLPILAPITIYRKIHYFHHGFNRKDDHTSALDTFVIKGKDTKLKRAYAFVVWYLSVFCGGFFLHSLVSVLLFLFVPPSLSVRISPAFKGWTWTDQLKSILLFVLGVALHLLVLWLGGGKVYLFALGFPMLSFAWWLSLLVYIFHYDTSKGDRVRYNVRSVRRVPFFSWILMNFNEHATHHQYPNIPWYELPSKRTPLPEEYTTRNQNTWNFFRAILNQFKGPVIVHEDPDQKSAA